MGVKIIFLPHQIEAEVLEGETIIDVAMRVGVHINASCGGIGSCNKCKIIVERGEVLGEKIDDFFYKACATIPKTELVVRVPVESQFDRRSLLRRTRAQSLQLKTDANPDPSIRTLYVEMQPPTIEDNSPDLERLLSRLKTFYPQNLVFPSNLLVDLPHVLREENFRITVNTIRDPLHNVEIVTRVRAGDRRGNTLGVAMDLGTTTLQLELIDLNSGETLASTSDYNPQISYGEDVISRIEFARKKEGLRLLADRIRERFSVLIDELLRETGQSPENVGAVAIAGNTVMTHLFLGLDPRYLREYPYVPVAKYYPLYFSQDLGIPLKENTPFYFAPSVASYVGGDITAGVMATNMAREPHLTLFIDLGTNGEIVIGNKDFLMCAACSAGPAFEGGGIKCGIRATSGAIESVSIDPITFEPMILTIGKKRAKGICGSGIISLLASLFRVGLIDRAGKFRRDLNSPRLRKGDEGYEYVLVFREESATGQDIVFTESDIENLMRAKGAMFAGYQILLESVGLTLADLDRVYLAGTFGSYIDLEDAITIGLLPDLPRDKFYFLGNTSLQGAKRMLLYREMLDEVIRIAQMMTHIELSTHPQYMDYYMATLFLPHTQEDLFPSIRGG